MKELKFWRCPVCGKLVWEVDESDAVPICCGRAMVRLAENIGGSAAEKHMPVAELTDGVVRVRVSSVLHPAMPDHYIEWIALQCEDRTGFRFLSPGEEPQVSFNAEGIEPEAVWAYCNLHGLWKGGVKKM